ncbi:unnamed protein product [Closterium sp. NIES-53]
MAGLLQVAAVGMAATVPASLNSLSSSDLSGSRLAAVAPSRARVQCNVTYAPPSTARLELLREAEERFARVEQQPTKGVAFTALEFEEALEKYDFNFDIGDKVRRCNGDRWRSATALAADAKQGPYQGDSSSAGTAARVVRGVVFKADNAGALIDIGAKAPALLPLAEACLFRLKNMSDTGLVPGMEAEFVVIDEDDSQGRMIVSLRKLQYDLAWERCRQLVADDVTVRGTVIAVNRGGLLVEVEGLRGFVPLSQIGLRAAKEDLVGTRIPLKFLEVDEERTRLVLSNRRAVAASHAQSLQVGDVVVGRVQSLKPYGAFVEIGGVNGLLHISQISHDRVTNVESVLAEGDQLKVMVLSFDSERGRVSLSTKKLEPTPGDMLRNPQLVFDKAEEMAATFKERVAAAEEAARAEEARLQQECTGCHLAYWLAPLPPVEVHSSPLHSLSHQSVSCPSGPTFLSLSSPLFSSLLSSSPLLSSPPTLLSSPFLSHLSACAWQGFGLDSTLGASTGLDPAFPSAF